VEFKPRLAFLYHSHRCEFRGITDSDVTAAYIEGLARERKYLENIPGDLTRSTQEAYIRAITESEKDAIFGLFMKSELVGTSGLQKVMETPTIGIFVFSEKNRNRGMGQTLVWASCYLVHHAFQSERYAAGMKKENVPSLKSFLRCGFSIISEDDHDFRVGLHIQSLKRLPHMGEIQIKH